MFVFKLLLWWFGTDYNRYPLMQVRQNFMFVEMLLSCRYVSSESNKKWLQNGPIASLVGKHPWVTRLGRWSKCGGSFAFVVALTKATKEYSGSFFLVTQTVHYSISLDVLSFFTLKYVSTLACFVFLFVKTGLEADSCCYIMATAVKFRTVTFCLFDKMTEMFSSVNSVPMRVSIATV